MAICERPAHLKLLTLMPLGEAKHSSRPSQPTGDAKRDSPPSQATGDAKRDSPPSKGRGSVREHRGDAARGVAEGTGGVALRAARAHPPRSPFVPKGEEKRSSLPSQATGEPKRDSPPSKGRGAVREHQGDAARGVAEGMGGVALRAARAHPPRSPFVPKGEGNRSSLPSQPTGEAKRDSPPSKGRGSVREHRGDAVRGAAEGTGGVALRAARAHPPRSPFVPKGEEKRDSPPSQPTGEAKHDSPPSKGRGSVREHRGDVTRSGASP